MARFSSILPISFPPSPFYPSPLPFDRIELNYPNGPEKLKELEKNGYTIVILTNQDGIEKGKVTIDSLKVCVSREMNG